MSNSVKIFQKAPVEVPKFSGFDMSHISIGTLKVGTLVPVLVEPCYPNDKISVGLNANVQLPPMATDFIGKVDLKFEAFFCPYRLLWQGWQRFYNNKDVDTYVSPVTRLPKILLSSENISLTDLNANLGPNTLADYLGFKFLYDDSSTFSSDIELPNPLPFLAYHMIYDRWYRDKVIQRPLFATPDEIDNMLVSEALDSDDKYNYYPAMLPYTYGPEGINSEYLSNYHTEPVPAPDEDPLEVPPTFDSYKFADDSSLFDLRQRNWAKDYFSVATTAPQAGSASKVEFSTAGATGSFSIAALRVANSLQKFAEKRNIAGGEYQDQILADWGITPADAVLQHPVFIGSQTINVYNRSIVQSANGSAYTSEEASRNPFTKTVGASFGKSQALGSGSIINNFHCKEHGIVMIIASLVPHAFYGTGTRKYLTYNEFQDFPNPNFVAVGDQQIDMSELASSYSYFEKINLSDPSGFGYTQRYAEKKFHNDEVHGLLRDGENLEYFAVQRSFDSSAASINSKFLEISTNAMDNVTAVQSDLSSYGAWYEIAFEEHMVSAFPMYSIPTLGDEKHTTTINVDKGGKRL